MHLHWSRVRSGRAATHVLTASRMKDDKRRAGGGVYQHNVLVKTLRTANVRVVEVKPHWETQRDHRREPRWDFAALLKKVVHNHLVQPRHAGRRRASNTLLRSSGLNSARGTQFVRLRERHRPAVRSDLACHAVPVPTPCTPASAPLARRPNAHQRMCLPASSISASAGQPARITQLCECGASHMWPRRLTRQQRKMCGRLL